MLFDYAQSDIFFGVFIAFDESIRKGECSSIAGYTRFGIESISLASAL